MRADFKTQWRNRRSVILVLLVPVIILISWKSLIEKLEAHLHLVNASQLAYSHRINGLFKCNWKRQGKRQFFQSLRVAPLPSWAIMASRLLVQLLMIFIITAAVLIAGYSVDNIVIPTEGYVLAFIAAIVGAAVYLAMGQVIVGLIKNPETVNATTRLVYFIFIMVGMFGQLGILGEALKKYVIWSPYGTVQTIIAGVWFLILEMDGYYNTQALFINYCLCRCFFCYWHKKVSVE